MTTTPSLNSGRTSLFAHPNYRPTLSDELIELAFSYHFTWGYPDYVRQAFLILIVQRKGTDKPLNPNKNLTWRELRILLEEADSPGIRQIVASNPKTPAAVLDFLSQVKSSVIVERVAENANAHVSTLARLALHENASVRLAICDNPSAPEAVLLALCNDECVDIRYRLAENTLMLDSVLQTLVADANPYVSSRAARTLAAREPVQIVKPDFSQASKIAARRRRSLSG